MSGVQLSRVTKDFGPVRVIHGVDLQVRQGEFCVFVGPSGCGKSTLLRMIAGLAETSTGQIMIENQDVTDADPADRGVAIGAHVAYRDLHGFGRRFIDVEPAELLHRAVHRTAQRLEIADVEPGRDDPAPLLLHQPYGLVQVLRRGVLVPHARQRTGDVDGDHVRALGRQPDAVRPPHAARRAGHQRDLPCHSSSRHDRSPLDIIR